MKKTIQRIMALTLCMMLCVSLLPVLTLAADDEVVINETIFPDPTFREYVRGFDTDNSGGLSQSEIASVKEIKQNYEDITSLKGIEFFTSLEVLLCWGNGDLRELDVSKNTALKSLKCNSCAIETLDVSRNTELTDLSCHANMLKKLDVSNNTKLESLYCYDNTLGKLDIVKNTTLKKLYCYNCGLQALDISANTRLEQLECNRNHIQTLDISNNPNLIRVLLNNEYPNDPSAEEQHYYIDAEKLHLFIDSGTHITFLTITSQPKSTTAVSGQKASFSVTAVGNDLTYQWYIQPKGSTTWTPISGATSAKLTLTVTGDMDGNKYRCMVTGEGNQTITSAHGTLTVVAKPKITTQPKKVSVKAGKKVTFKVKASGYDLKYQWYVMKTGSKKWVKVKKATKPTLKFKVTKKMNGYKYRCKVYNAAGYVYSKAVKLKVKK